MSLNYYSEFNQGKVSTSNDLNSNQQPMPLGDCNNFYLSPAPMGWYLDLGAEKIGNRPVWQSFQVGNPTNLTPNKYRQPGKFNCHQPCWQKNCK